MELIDNYRKVLGFLIDNLFAKFTECATERGDLNTIELAGGDELPSILGEVEVLTDTVVGITRTCLKREPKNIEDFLDILERSSIYQQEHLIDWIIHQGPAFPGFLRYMMLVENLRVATVVFLEKKGR